MGAHNFETYGVGKTALKAYEQAVQSALHEYGHNSYNGTISTTTGCVDVSDWFPKGTRTATKKKICRAAHFLPGYFDRAEERDALKGLTKEQKALAKRISPYCREKWGTCVCVEMGRAVGCPRGTKKYWFIGWAAS